MHILCIGFGLQVHFIGVKEKYILKKHKQIEIGTTECTMRSQRNKWPNKFNETFFISNYVLKNIVWCPKASFIAKL